MQRVPSTDSSGRVHTSTVTVAVLPEIKDIDVDLRQSDIRYVMVTADQWSRVMLLIRLLEIELIITVLRVLVDSM